MATRLDAFDLRILEIVQSNNLTTHRQIADAVNLSTPAVARRLQRLRDEGAIWKDVSVLSPKQVGNRLTVIVHIALENETLRQLDAIKARFAACAQIQQCYYVTSDIDFVLIMSVSDMDEYHSLTRTLFADDINVKQFTTSVSVQPVKVSLEIPFSRSEGPIE